MQLCQLKRNTQLSVNKFICSHTIFKQQYILTILSPSQFNKHIEQLNHPNLLIPSEYWEEKGQICLVQPIEQLINLIELIKTNKLNENGILSLIYQIVNALFYLEQEHVQTSFSPTNIFVDPQLQVKIDVLEIGQVPIGMQSPEVIRKECMGSGLWSVGCIAYFLMKNILPFDGSTDKTTIYNILYKDPPIMDQSEFPLVTTIIKAIFIKIKQRRVGTKDVLNYLQTKRINFNNDLKIQRTRSMKSVMSITGSVVKTVEQSIAQSSPSPLVQILTLDMFEQQQSQIKSSQQYLARPQSSIDQSRELISKIKSLRPNSALSLTSKQFITKSIKQEIQDRRSIVSAQQPQKNNNKKKKHHKEISIDLDNAEKLKDKDGDTIRVYNMEYQENQGGQQKNQKIYLRTLKQKLTQPNEYPIEQMQDMQKWQSKISSMLI